MRGLAAAAWPWPICFFLRRPAARQHSAEPGWAAPLHRFWFAGWGFDWLYDRAVRAARSLWLAAVNQGDVVDCIYTAIAWLSRLRASRC